MITPSVLANAFELSVSLALLGVLLLKLLPSLRLDEFRQSMFTLRDQLFDYAAAGNISFSHPAYRLLRRLMNGHIRFAHQLTFFSICLMLLDWRFVSEKPKAEWFESWQAALKTIDCEQTRIDLQLFHSKAITLGLSKVIYGSPILLGAVMVVTLLTAVNQGVLNISSAITSAKETVLAKLIAPELIEEEAARTAA